MATWVTRSYSFSLTSYQPPILLIFILYFSLSSSPPLPPPEFRMPSSIARLTLSTSKKVSLPPCRPTSHQSYTLQLV